MSAPCPRCQHIHPSNAARAVGLFSRLAPTYVSSLGGPERVTRAEAQDDWCEQQASSRTTEVEAAPAPDVAASVPSPKGIATASTSVPVPLFPAVEMETAARAKAWRDFLAQVRLSLLVWDIDGEVREGCEDVLAWIRRCREDLAFGGAS